MGDQPKRPVGRPEDLGRHRHHRELGPGPGDLFPIGCQCLRAYAESRLHYLAGTMTRAWRSSEGYFRRKMTEPASEGLSRNNAARVFEPGCKRLCFAKRSDIVVRSDVMGLLFGGRPTAVRRLVVTILVDAVNGEIVGVS